MSEQNTPPVEQKPTPADATDVQKLANRDDHKLAQRLVKSEERVGALEEICKVLSGKIGAEGKKDDTGKNPALGGSTATVAAPPTVRGVIQELHDALFTSPKPQPPNDP